MTTVPEITYRPVGSRADEFLVCGLGVIHGDGDHVEVYLRPQRTSYQRPLLLDHGTARMRWSFTEDAWGPERAAREEAKWRRAISKVAGLREVDGQLAMGTEPESQEADALAMAEAIREACE